ncbi:MAG: ABC transporter ATP-binding protein [Desulfomonilaceae bacterium]
MDAAPIIRVEALVKSYETQRVLDGVYFSIQRGSITTIMGVSGAGKSVLLRHLIALDRPDSGAVYVDGEDIFSMSPKRLNRMRRRLGVLFQDAALFDSLSVWDNVAFPIREHSGLPRKRIPQKVEEKLGMVGMLKHQSKLPAELSGGMRKRVGLARALAMDPEIVFFDEPTTGLDPVTRAAIYRLIRRAHDATGGTFVIVSHDIEGVLEISHELFMLWNGKIVAQGTPEQIRESSDPLVRQFVSGSADGPIDVDMTSS